MIKLARSTGIVLALVLAAACGGSRSSSTTPTAAASPCGPMASHVAAELRATVAAGGDDAALVEQAAQVMERVMSGRCQADGWSAEAVGCFTAATGQTMPDCEAKLTPVQKDAVQKELEAELAKLTPPPGAPEEAEEAAPAPDDPCGGGE